MLNRHLGTSAISAAQPQGLSPRDGDTFAALQAEMGKRVDLHAAEPLDWSLVATLASQILHEQGKDLSAATWLCAAWFRLHGASGLAAGLQVLRDLHVVYWDGMSPPAARIRGRRNQVQWLLDECEAILSEPDWDGSGLATQERADTLALCDELDAFWQARDDEAPAWWRLGKRLADQLPLPAQQDEPAADAPVAEQEQPEGLPEPRTEPPVPAAPTPKANPALIQVRQPDAAAENEAREALDLNDPAAVERHAEQRLAALQEVLSGRGDALLAAPWLLRLNRQIAWLFLEELPFSQEGVTRVTPPSVTDRDVLQRLVEAQDPQAILRFVESRLGRLRFWLDLNRVAHEAASALPQGQGAAQAIAAESAHLLRRLPGLQQLAFSDGQPFADEQTRRWLMELSGPVPASAPAATPALVRQEPLPAGGNLDVLSLTSLVMAAGAEAEAARRLLDGALERLKMGGEQLMRAR